MSVAQQLKTGYTTGSCAAAASEAALRLILGDRVQQVTLDLPNGGQLEIPIKNVVLANNAATAEVVKDAGDDPDVTHGISIIATVELIEGGEIIIEGGVGVGIVTKPGLAVIVGQAAINPVPRQMICSAVEKYLPPGKGLRVVVSVPEGEKVARRTMNSRLGIRGGISILGTTGIVRPMSEEAYLASLVPQLDQAVALGYRTVVLTPGAMGARMAREQGINEDAIIQCSNFVGLMLRECSKRPLTGILLLGHIGKFIKVAAGIFNTHSQIADARKEILAAHAALHGASRDIIKGIMELATMEASIELINENSLQSVYLSIAESCSRRSKELLPENIEVGTAIYSLQGNFLAYDKTAVELGRALKCRVL